MSGMLWGPAPVSSCAGSMLAGMDPGPESLRPGAGSPRQGVGGARVDAGDAPPQALPHALAVPASCGDALGCGCGCASSSCVALLRSGHMHRDGASRDNLAHQKAVT